MPTLDDIKNQIISLEKVATSEQEKARVAGATRLKILKEMEADKKNLMIKVKQQRVDLLKYLQLINKHDGAYKNAKNEVERLKALYASESRNVTEKQLELL